MASSNTRTTCPGCGIKVSTPWEAKFPLKPCSVCRKVLCGHELLLVDNTDHSPDRAVICEPCKYPAEGYTA